MKKIASRTIASLLLVVILLGCFGIYIVKWLIDGDDWAAFPVNRHAYNSEAVLSVGTIVDKNGTVLAGVEDGQRIFCEDALSRRAALHVVGDAQGNIGTGLLSSYDNQLMGYNIFTGVYSRTEQGNTVHTTIDADVCRVALSALNGQRGAIAVYNYRTGRIVCMVSAPGFDPYAPPDLSGDVSDYYNGAYINRAMSSTFAPGSTFKLLTLSAAIETLPDLWEQTFHCGGAYEIGYDVITCTAVHGDIGIKEALASSCNCAFAQLALQVGGESIRRQAEKAGLLDSFTVSGIRVAAGNFDIAADGTSDLAWSGIGQYTDLVNPLAMARYMGAIANGGATVAPRIVDGVTSPLGLPAGMYWRGVKSTLVTPSTAKTLKQMMLYTGETYGDFRFPGLTIGAKSGTAEIEAGDTPHAWFVGFLEDPANPYAFAVFVENGGWGLSTAGAIANTVLQALVD